VLNPDWNPATDPNAKQLNSRITLNLNVNQTVIDNGLLAGEIDVDAQGAGVGSTAQARILSSPADKADADNPLNGFARFFYLNTKVAPLDNAHCRQAVEYAADKTAIQTRQQLAMCGQPAGFSTNLAYRDDNSQETAAATALKSALARVGIKVTLKGASTDAYYTSSAGSTAYVHSHDIGIAAGVWQGDWSDGFAFLDDLSAGNAINSVGNTNISELNDSAVNDLFDQSATAPSATRTALWPQIDEQVMKDAAILPGIYVKTVLYRPPNLTNVYVQAYYGMYNYAVLGVSS